MNKRHQSLCFISYVIIILFISATILPSCIAQAPIPKINREQSPQDLFIKRADRTNEQDNNSFNFAIVWGRFEVRGNVFPFLALDVHNRAPWYN